MNYLSFYIHGNASDHNEILETLTRFLAFFEGLTANSGASNGSNFLEGIASLTNIHPLLVHFPIALLSLFVVVDLVGTAVKKSEWRSFAGGLLYLGTVFAGLTVWAGMRAAETVPHGHNVHAIMERHEQLGFSILALSMALLAWRLRRPVEGWGIYNFFTVILAGVLIFGADLGGLMVYKYGVAVEAVVISAEEARHHTHDESK